jgi:hypothetical protein
VRRFVVVFFVVRRFTVRRFVVVFFVVRRFTVRRFVVVFFEAFFRLRRSDASAAAIRAARDLPFEGVFCDLATRSANEVIDTNSGMLKAASVGSLTASALARAVERWSVPIELQRRPL